VVALRALVEGELRQAGAAPPAARASG
jgi:hypothetical protein